MQLTDSRGTAFTVNSRHIVYVKARGSDATILLSRGNQVVDVAESVSEVITEAGGALVAFTALAGDVVGSVGINPRYIVTVASYSSGTQSQVVLMDDDYNTTRTTMTLSSSYASMEALVEETSAAASLDGTETVKIVQDGEVVETTTQDIADLGGGGGASYLKYVALLTQTGTDAPVATVLENTLGGTVVWSYSGVGVYFATLSGVFTLNKTFAIVGSYGGQNGAFPVDADIVAVATANASGVGENGTLANTAIEIRVYP